MKLTHDAEGFRVTNKPFLVLNYNEDRIVARFGSAIERRLYLARRRVKTGTENVFEYETGEPYYTAKEAALVRKKEWDKASKMRRERLDREMSKQITRDEMAFSARLSMGAYHG